MGEYYVKVSPPQPFKYSIGRSSVSHNTLCRPGPATLQFQGLMAMGCID